MSDLPLDLFIADGCVLDVRNQSVASFEVVAFPLKIKADSSMTRAVQGLFINENYAFNHPSE